MNKETITKESVNYQQVGEAIPHAMGIQMVKTHILMHGQEGSHAFVVGRDILEKLLAQPGCVAIRIYDAINEFGNKTLVNVGVSEDGKNILEYKSVNEHGKIVVTEGLIQDKIIWGPSSVPGTEDNPFVID